MPHVPLHLTKVAVGCPDLDALAARMAGRAVDGVAEAETRFRPTRHAELDGGSIYWIIKHRLVARQPILGFRELEGQKRWAIRLGADLIAIRPRFMRVHQGWRYLEDDHAPDDMGGPAAAALPPALAAELDALALI